jgi:hypothetical protein
VTPGELALLREILSAYLVDFRREVAGTESPTLRGHLSVRQGRLARLLVRLMAAAPGADPRERDTGMACTVFVSKERAT